jgi:hypothetical protein
LGPIIHKLATTFRTHSVSFCIIMFYFAGLQRDYSFHLSFPHFFFHFSSWCHYIEYDPWWAFVPPNPTKVVGGGGRQLFPLIRHLQLLLEMLTPMLGRYQNYYYYYYFPLFLFFFLCFYMILIPNNSLL